MAKSKTEAAEKATDEVRTRNVIDELPLGETIEVEIQFMDVVANMFGVAVPKGAEEGEYLRFIPQSLAKDFFEKLPATCVITEGPNGRRRVSELRINLDALTSA